MIQDLRQRELAILKSRVQPPRTVSPEERELRQEQYTQSEASLQSVLNTVTRTVRYRKENLLPEYSERGLREESAWYQAVAELFYDMANVRNHDLFTFVGKSPQRKRDAMEVFRKAQVVSEYYERQSRNPKQFLQSTASTKIHQLLVALENL